MHIVPPGLLNTVFYKSQTKLIYMCIYIFIVVKLISLGLDVLTELEV